MQPQPDHTQALQTISLIQGIVLAIGMLIVGGLMKTFSAGSKFRDFERANKLMSELASTVNTLPDKYREEMQEALDRYHQYVVEPRLEELRREFRRLEEIVDRRRDGDRRHDHD